MSCYHIFIVIFNFSKSKELALSLIYWDLNIHENEKKFTESAHGQ